ncbi:MAG TPA: sigma-54 dependent transcriptional regulator, partial [Gammaproteobacteria bacterium]|nr:sigma-54 dependent transcriptional regulator [Gammaproteobacteria bacterium]
MTTTNDTTARENAPSILIVDDEFSVRDSLNEWFRKDGYNAGSAENAHEALKLIQARRWDVVLLDIKMSGMDGLELQRRIREIDPELVVIMITAFASVESAVQALKHGAFDYITKPIDPDELSHLVRRALEQRALREENVRLRESLDDIADIGTIVGESAAMRRMMELVRQVAKTDATVLIRGESGTGKELIARAIHAHSERRYFPIVPVSCGALPETLLESELFGHEKGAFTGAQYRRKGKLEMADGGTLFLDEVGTLNPKTQVDLLRVLEAKEVTRIGAKMQVDLLRVLEEHEVTRVGASRPLKVDFRVICATNEDLERYVAEGRFREDLYYRIDVVSIVAPPLRERKSDIPLLARH